MNPPLKLPRPAFPSRNLTARYGLSGCFLIALTVFIANLMEGKVPRVRRHYRSGSTEYLKVATLRIPAVPPHPPPPSPPHPDPDPDVRYPNLRASPQVLGPCHHPRPPRAHDLFVHTSFLSSTNIPRSPYHTIHASEPGFSLSWTVEWKARQPGQLLSALAPNRLTGRIQGGVQGTGANNQRTSAFTRKYPPPPASASS